MLKNPQRILCIALPGIGDALLATPLLATLKRSYPNVKIDIIVRAGREGIIRDNLLIETVLPFPRRPTIRDHLKLIAKILWRYNFAISTSPSDRSYLFCLIAAPRRANIVPRKCLSHYWKYLIGDIVVPLNEKTHTVTQNLELLKKLKLEACYDLIMPCSTEGTKECRHLIDELSINHPFVVVHVFPGSEYKLLPLEFWQKVLQHLTGNGYKIVLTGGVFDGEKEYCARLAGCFSANVYNACGSLSFSAVSELIQLAEFFVGNDTSTTHLAAASGKLTFSLFGPSNVLKWSPWPKGYSLSVPPFHKTPGIQRNGNVVVVHTDCKCKDFNRKCQFSPDNFSVCLQKMDPALMIEALETHAGTVTRTEEQARG